MKARVVYYRGRTALYAMKGVGASPHLCYGADKGDVR